MDLFRQFEEVGGKDGGSGTNRLAGSSFKGRKNRAIEAVYPADGDTVVIANEIVAKFSLDFSYLISTRFSDGTDLYKSEGLRLSWSCGKAADSYTVLLSDSKNMQSAKTFETAEATVTVKDLFVVSEYFWQVRAKTAEGEIVSDVFRFTTAQTPRTIDVEGVSNTRDIGGYCAADGKRIKQGMVYRGAMLEGITESGIQSLLGAYGVRTEIDLRGAHESKNILGDRINYVQISAPAYTTPNGTTGIDVPANQPLVAQEIKVFADEKNYPVYVHCAGGRDRTGTLILLLEALLGVNMNDLFLDYETSLLSQFGCADGTPVEKLYSTFFYPTYMYLCAYGEGTLMRNCERYLLDIGVTASEIAAIRSLLLV